MSAAVAADTGFANEVVGLLRFLTVSRKAARTLSSRHRAGASDLARVKPAAVDHVQRGRPAHVEAGRRGSPDQELGHTAPAAVPEARHRPMADGGTTVFTARRRWWGTSPSSWPQVEGARVIAGLAPAM